MKKLLILFLVFTANFLFSQTFYVLPDTVTSIIKSNIDSNKKYYSSFDYNEDTIFVYISEIDTKNNNAANNTKRFIKISDKIQIAVISIEDELFSGNIKQEKSEEPDNENLTGDFIIMFTIELRFLKILNFK